MAIINFAHREITAKVVYFGARGSGCQTNIEKLHELLPADEKSRLHQFGTDDDAVSFYFDLVPEGGGEINGFATRFRVYSVPSLDHVAHRNEVFKGTDAVVFVADARAQRATANVDNLLDLESALTEQGLDMATLPMVFQVNHMDDPDARPPEQVVYDLNPYGFPVIGAVARDTRGVLETFERVTRETVSRIRDNLSGTETALTLTAVHHAELERDEDIIRRHLDAISSLPAPPRTAEASPEVTFSQLPPEGEIELSMYSEGLAHVRPIHVISAAVADDCIVVDVVLERPTGTPKRLRVILSNDPSTPTPSRNTSSTAVRLARREDDATGHLPDRIEFPNRFDDPSDLPGIWYGIAGVAGGALVGLLLGFLLFT